MNSALLFVFYRIKTLFIPYLFLLCGSLAIYIYYSRESIYYTINSFHFAAADLFFTSITHLGDALSCLLISLVAGLLNYRKGLLLATSYLLTAAIAQLLKRIFDAPRPKIYFESSLQDIYFIPGLDLLTVHSFPSGHTVSIFTAATVLTYVSRKKAWGIVFLAVAILVGYSRMYLSQHFFEDVVVGSVIGVFLTAIWLSWIDRLGFLQQENWDRGLFKKNGTKF